MSKLHIYNHDSPHRTIRTLNDMESLFDGIDSVCYVEFFESVIDKLDVTLHDIIIIKTCDATIPHDFCEEEYGIIDIDDNEFELVSVVAVSDISTRFNHGWTGNVYSRHGGNHKSWWTQSRDSNICIQSHNFSIEDGVFYSDQWFLYVKKSNTDFAEERKSFMEYIGGRTNVMCSSHQFPLIASVDKSNKCRCGKKEFVTCAHLSCNCCLCKSCYEDLDNDEEHFIDPSTEVNDGQSVESNDSDDESSSSSDNSISTASSFNLSDDMSVDDILNAEDFDDYVTSRTNFDFDDGYVDPDTVENEEDNLSFCDVSNQIPSTNAGEYAFQIEEATPILKGVHISVHTLLNQCASLLVRNNHKLIGYNTQKHLMQHVCATTIGESVPLLFMDGALFPSIFYKSVDKDGSIVGVRPCSLLTGEESLHGFTPVPDEVKSRLTSVSVATSTNPTYISYSYDMLTNLAMNRQDGRIILNRGLTLDERSKSGFGVRCKNDSSLFESVDNKQMVRNLCSSSEKHPMDLFLTFTCNQKEHFGVKCIRNWIDSGDWKQHYNEYRFLSDSEQDEVNKAIHRSSASLILRNWMETRALFLQYLLKSESSCFQSVSDIFARDEYQYFVGNLPHIHLMLRLNRDKIQSENFLSFIEDLVRASVVDLVRSEEVEDMIEKGLMKNVAEREDVIDLASSILAHVSSPRTVARIKPGDGPDAFVDRKPNNLLLSPDNTKHCYIPIGSNLTIECKEILQSINLMDKITVNQFGFESTPIYNHDLFKGNRHIPPTNPNNDLNISPANGELFAATKSMQNIQILTNTNGCHKYVNKYIGKIDETNYIIVGANGSKHGSLVTHGTFLHNTKISSSKINEDKALQKKRDKDHARGRGIGVMEMLQMSLGYPEVHTNLVFVSIPTMPLELRAGIETHKFRPILDNDNRLHRNNNIPFNQPLDDNGDPIEDAAYVGIESDLVRRSMELNPDRQMRESELLILQGSDKSSISIDKVSKFSVRPPELRQITDKLGDYFRFFYVTPSKLRYNDIATVINDDVWKSAWVDGLGHIVKVRYNAIHELATHCQFLLNEELYLLTDTTESIAEMIIHISEITKTIEELDDDDDETSLDNVLSETDLAFYNFAQKQLIHPREKDLSYSNLPVPVYTFTRPSMGHQFILHILLSMGRFETEVDLTLHSSLRKSLRYAKLIGPNDDNESLQQYSKDLLKKFVLEQCVKFPNSMREIDSFIIDAAHLFDDIIINDTLPITDLPPVLQTAIHESNEMAQIKYWKDMRSSIISSARAEIGEEAIVNCNVPTSESLMNATRQNHCNWNLCEHFSRGDCQSIDSFHEQHFALNMIQTSIDSYCNCTQNGSNYVKCVGVHGVPGGGKSFVGQIACIYALSKGLRVIATSMMSRRSVHLGGSHIHRLFALDVKDYLSPQRSAERAIIQLNKDPVKIDALKTVHIIFLDEAGQVSAELLSIIDMVLRRVRSNDLPFGGVLILCTFDHQQLQPIKGKPFLISSHIISCFKFAKLQHSVRANSDPNFQRLQNIARMHPGYLSRNRHILREFKELASNVFEFASDWTSDKIDPNTHRLYGKRYPAQEATRMYIEQVKSFLSNRDIRESKSNDVQNPMYSHGEWQTASAQTTRALNKEIKEPENLLFFKGAVYECTFNEDGHFSTSQICILIDLPDQDDLDNFRKVEVLIAPPGIQDVEYNPDKGKDEYIAEGWRVQKVGTAPERIHKIQNRLQAQRRQYGLRHRVTSTIHAAMGDTLIKVAIEVSNSDSLYKLWDKAQVIVACSRTKVGKNTIFVGDKSSIIEALVTLIQQKNQWTDYMEKVLEIVTINNDQGASDDNDGTASERGVFDTNECFPFRLCDVSLPSCKTGFVYFLVSLRDPAFTYIGMTNDINRRLQQHNSGNGSSSTVPLRLRPYALFAYICGFECNTTLLSYVESQWKIKRNRLRDSGILCQKQWARRGGHSVIDAVHNSANNNYDLRLILLFRDDHHLDHTEEGNN